MPVERKFAKQTNLIGKTTFNFWTEKIDGNIISDTEVTVSAGCLCWIAFAKVDEFTNELKSLIEKYQI